MGVGGRSHAFAALPQETDPLPNAEEVVWAPVLIWSGAENLSPPDRPARSESLYLLSFPGLHNPSNTMYIRHRYEELTTCFG